MPIRPLRPVTPEVVADQVVLEELDLSPDGATAVIVRRRTRGIEYVRDLLLVPLSGGRPRRLATGTRGDSHPRFSPDGRRLAYLAARPGANGSPAKADGPLQVWVIDPRGGGPWRLTDEVHGVTGFAWSPDGARIALWGWAGPPRFIEGACRDGRSPTARRITRGTWHWNEVGFLDRRTHLSAVPVRRRARPSRLTAGDFDVLFPVWDADGLSLVFAADRGPEADLFPRPRAWRVPADGSAARDGIEPAEVTALGDGIVDAVSASPDGRWLALAGTDVPGAPDWAGPSLYLARADGSGVPTRLAPELDLPFGDWLDCDLTGWTSSSRPGPFWTSDAQGRAEGLIAILSERGRSRPWRLPFDPRTGAAGPATPLASGESVCWSLAAAGGRVAVLGTLGDRAVELMEVRGGAYRTRTRIGSAWQARYRPTLVREVAIPGPGGPIDTWLASPPDAGNDRLPLVVDLHGGPLGAWSPAPWLEARLLVEAGFRVASPNIRGSSGYGADWIRAHTDSWGAVDAEDVLAVVDHLVAAGLADPDRVGLLGLSYGGYLVNWLIGAHPDRFAAAVSEGGVTDLRVSWAISDSGPDFHRRAGLAEPLTAEGAARLWEQSPYRNVWRIRTPLLLLQGEEDRRCPPADNVQLFVTLRALGRDVELVLYPESAHTYAVTGRPDRRKDRHRRMLDWFRRHLA